MSKGTSKTTAVITTNGRAVWVNTAISLGRFGKIAVDVHADKAAQLAGAHCLDCFTHTHDIEAN